MLIKEKIGNLSSFEDDGRAIDRLPLEWYECTKRILHKKTGNGREVVLKFLKEAHQLQPDDVLYADAECLIVVDVLPCEAIVLTPASMYEMAYACYAIGNKHLPIYYNNDALVLPYDPPILKVLQTAGLKPEVQKKQLTGQLITTGVSTHAHDRGVSLLSKILKLTTPANG
jgi:urease accessory protein